MRRLCRTGSRSKLPALMGPRTLRGNVKIIAILVLGTLASSAQAQSFSADLVTTNETGRAMGKPGKLYVGDRKVHVETPEIPNGFFLIDTAAQTAYLVRPAQQVFMDAKQSTRLTQLLVRVDPVDPCLQWQAMAKIAGASDRGGEWHCDRLGKETLDGRATVKYRVVSPHGQSSVAWIDSDLGFLLRIRDKDETGIDVRIIEEGPQAESLFEFPANYGKFNPMQLIERIKRSDVWVEPPK